MLTLPSKVPCVPPLATFSPPSSLHLALLTARHLVFLPLPLSPSHPLAPVSCTCHSAQVWLYLTGFLGGGIAESSVMFCFMLCPFLLQHIFPPLIIQLYICILGYFSIVSACLVLLATILTRAVFMSVLLPLYSHHPRRPAHIRHQRGTYWMADS